MKKFYIRIFSIAFMSFLQTFAFGAGLTQDDQTHLIRRGESLYSIAKKYPGVSVADIVSYNSLSSSKLVVGQVLRIPMHQQVSLSPTDAPVRATDGKLWGYKNKEGNWVILPQYKSVKPFSEGYAPVMIGKRKWIYIDQTGSQAVPGVWYEGNEFSEGYFVNIPRKGDDHSQNYYDASGNALLDIVQDDDMIVDGTPFKDGVASAAIWGFSVPYGNRTLIFITLDGKIHYTKEEALTHIQSLRGSQLTVADSANLKPEVPATTSVDGYKPSPQTQLSSPEQTPAASSVCSDVDVNIPLSRKSNENTFAVIIANEDYKRESDVRYAANDGKIFRQYCSKTLGLPDVNIHYVQDATLNDIRAELNWMSKVATAYNGDAKLIFYYAGHGIPDESTHEAYILPVDAYASDFLTAFSVSDLYSRLSECPSLSTVVFLDACFSGSQRTGQMISSARGVAIKAKPNTPKGNMVVFSAASGDETAYPYEEKSHGMFTYFLLKKLQETQGQATLGELAEYIKSNVSRKSIVQNMKSQTPDLSVSPALEKSWSSLKL